MRSCCSVTTRLGQVDNASRNAAIGPIHALGSAKVAATCRLFAAQPRAAFLAPGTRAALE